MPLPDQAVRSLTSRHQTRLDRLALTARTVVGDAWDSLQSWDDPAALVRLAGPYLTVLSDNAAAQTAAYIATILETPIAPTASTVVPAWDDPFISLRRAISAGRSFEEALISGRARAEAVGSNTVVSSSRRAGDQVASGLVRGWLRTLSADPCDWCQVVATRTYKSSESADFGHDRCSCGVTPITA
jgi:hypothetical protein